VLVNVKFQLNTQIKLLPEKFSITAVLRLAERKRSMSYCLGLQNYWLDVMGVPVRIKNSETCTWIGFAGEV